MKRILLIIVLLYPLLNVAQNYQEGNKMLFENTDSVVCSFATIKPKFNGDETDALFIKYVSNELIYPLECKANKIEGVVYLEFIIEKNGKVTNVKILRGSSNVKLNNEALRVIQNSPNWEPGFLNGEPVRVKKVFPVRFKLN